MVVQMETCDKAKASTSSSNDDQQRGPINRNLDMCTSLSTRAYSDPSTELHKFRAAMLQPSVEKRLSHLKHFVGNSKEAKKSEEDIAKLLVTAECWLSDVILLRDVKLTRAFLRERQKKSNYESQLYFVPPEIVLLRNLRLKLTFPRMRKIQIIDCDSRASVDLVVSNLDLKNAEAIVKYGPDKDVRVRYLFVQLLTMATKQQANLKVFKAFAKRLVDWNVLPEDASLYIELEIFQKAKMRVIDWFLKFGIVAHVERVFGRNILTALFGNTNVSVGFLRRLEFDVNARGNDDFTALHYAMQSSLVDRVKFLLDCGADPNARNRRDETPLILALNKPQAKSIENKRCAEILLQFGADPFLCTSPGISFGSCVRSDFTLTSRYFMELAMAYFRVYKASGAANLSKDHHKALKAIDMVVKENDCLFDFYMECKQQISVLKAHRIRDDLSMFTILSMTGDKLVHLLHENDCQIIHELIFVYKRTSTLNYYYLDALKEHMRQFRRFLTCKNRAIQVCAEELLILTKCHAVLEKIVSFIPANDLLVYQVKSEKLERTKKCPTIQMSRD